MIGALRIPGVVHKLHLLIKMGGNIHRSLSIIITIGSDTLLQHQYSFEGSALPPYCLLSGSVKLTSYIAKLGLLPPVGIDMWRAPVLHFLSNITSEVFIALHTFEEDRVFEHSK